MSSASDPSFTPAEKPSADQPAATDPSAAIQAGAPAPASATAVQTAPPESSIPLPPLPAGPRERTTPEQLARETGRLDRVLTVLVLGLAVVVSAAAIRNSDFWMHLATGRLLAHGEYTLGVDPYSYMSGGNYWVNASWLFDLVVYGLTQLGGGPEAAAGGAVLAIFKALLILAITWLMLQIRRPGQSLWAPAACTALALVAMSPRLILQPTLVSVLFVVLTLFILQRPRFVSAGARRSGQRSPLTIYWLLPPLFLLWVNLDAWFILGPALVALYLLGQAIQQFLMPIRTGEDAPEPRQLPTLLLVLGVGVVACLINPHHYHAFTLPSDISLQTPRDLLSTDTYLYQLFLWVFDDRFVDSGEMWYIDTWANFTLLLAGVVSFLLCFLADFRWWRLLVWLGFATLAIFQLRYVPMFAVVAAPITALNLQDFATLRFGRVHRVERGWLAWSLGGRIASLLLVLVAGLLAWPGWLHGLPQGDAPQAEDFRSTRASWGLYVDASMRQTAQQLRTWHLDGQINQDDHGFNYTPDVVNYCAWFCADDAGRPLEQGFYDYRFSLFPEAAADNYVDIRHSLQNEVAPSTKAGTKSVNWEAIFRKNKIGHFVLTRNGGNALKVGLVLTQKWQEWVLVYTDGQTSIFRWNDPRKRANPDAGLPRRFDPNPLAFGPEATRAPESGPTKAPERLEKWELFLYGTPPRPLDGDAARRYVLYFQESPRFGQIPLWVPPYMLTAEWLAWAGTISEIGLTPSTSTGTYPATVLTATQPVRTQGLAQMDFMLRGRDAGPPGALLLAVRAARRAIAESPEDFNGYFALAQAYEALWLKQEETWTTRPYNPRAPYPRQKMRQIQIITAWEYSLRLRPNEFVPHYQLFDHYQQMGYMDLALEHLGKAVEILETIGLSPDVDREAYRTQLEALRKTHKALDEEVNKQRNRFVLESADKALGVKVQMAMGRGLAKRALDLLQEDTEGAQIDIKEANQELELLLTTGRPHDVRQLLEDSDLRPRMGLNYDLVTLFRAAAAGDYLAAATTLEETIAELEQANAAQMVDLLRGEAFQGNLGPGTIFNIGSLLERVGLVGQFMELRGLLALEEGDIATATRWFNRAEEISNQGQFYIESRPIGVRYLQLIDNAKRGR
jgi:tetratricopeptide (TPR) repeat protein